MNTTRWLIGFAMGLIGDQIFYLALSWTAAQTTTATMAGIIVGIGALPRAILLPFGGAVADRFGAKMTALSSDAARLVLMVVFTALAFALSPSAPLLIVLALAFGIIDAFFLPSVAALPTRMVPPEGLTRLQSLRSAIQRVASVAGPPLGGFLLAYGGLAVALLANSVFFLCSVLALYFTREQYLPDNAQSSGTTAEEDTAQATSSARFSLRSLFADSVEGLHYTLTQPDLRSLFLFIALAEFAVSGPFNTALPLLGIDRSWNATDIGTMLSCFAIGAGVTATLLAIHGPRKHAGLLASVAIIAMGPAVAGIGFSSSFVSAAICAGITGLASGICATILTTLFLVRAAADHAARVMAALSLASYCGTPLSYFLAGVIADVFSPAAVFYAGGILVTVMGCVGVASPRIRQMQL